MINMITSARLDIPVIDGDFMGRAYPTGWQVTQNVYDKGNKGESLLPCAMTSGDGSVVVSTSLAPRRRRLLTSPSYSS